MFISIGRAIADSEASHAATLKPWRRYSSANRPLSQGAARKDRLPCLCQMQDETGKLAALQS